MDNNPAPKRPAPLFAGPEVHISAKNFGPIESGAIDLRPLNVFVGPGNTGKTYVAVLIYAMHRILHGFRLTLPLSFWQTVGLIRDNATEFGDDVRRVSDIFNSKDDTLRLSDLPRSIREDIYDYFGKSGPLPEELRMELISCFDIEDLGELVREPKGPHTSEIRLETRRNGRQVFGFRAGITGKELDFCGDVNENMALFSQMDLDSNPELKKVYERFRAWTTRAREVPEHIGRHGYRFLLIDLFDHLKRILMYDRANTFFLPVARSGIMQSYTNGY